MEGIVLLFSMWRHCLKKNERRIISLILGVIVLVAGMFCYMYFNASNIQNKLKEKVCESVLEHEIDLLEIVDACKKKEGSFLILDKENDDNSLYYKNLDNKTINEIFKAFKLVAIYKINDETILFTVKPSILNALWVGYGYGFYYTETDRPVDAFWRGDECDEEKEGVILDIGEYWYKTEQISDNWWFYEGELELYSVNVRH